MRGVLIFMVGVLLAGCTSSGGTTFSDGGPVDTSEHGGGWQDILPAKAQRVAAHGDASAIHLVRMTYKPWEGCDRPNAFGWTSAGGRQLAADELAWFVQSMPSNPNCSAFLYLFHDAFQTRRTGFNTGAVIYDGGLLIVHVGKPNDAPVYEFKTH